MTLHTDTPKPVRAGIVIDPDRGGQRRVIVMQFNPDTLERGLVPQASGAEQGDRTEALRLRGPAIETWKFTAEINAADHADAGRPPGAAAPGEPVQRLGNSAVEGHPAAPLERHQERGQAVVQ